MRKQLFLPSFPQALSQGGNHAVMSFSPSGGGYCVSEFCGLRFGLYLASEKQPLRVMRGEGWVGRWE